MRKTLLCLFYFLGISLSAQSKWTIGGNIGTNSSSLLYEHSIENWDFKWNATTLKYGFLVKYHLNQHWAIRVERNVEKRGLNYPKLKRIGDPLLSIFEVVDKVEHLYYFLTLPICIEGSIGKKSILQAAFGITPMYQSNATIRLRSTGQPIDPFIRDPRSMLGSIQWGWLAKAGYSQSIYRQLHLYVEGSFNLNWSAFDKTLSGSGSHYAFACSMGLTYRLPSSVYWPCEKLKP
jgi:Outer membrane protein beta-barrel domain